MSSVSIITSAPTFKIYLILFGILIKIGKNVLIGIKQMAEGCKASNKTLESGEIIIFAGQGSYI